MQDLGDANGEGEQEAPEEEDDASEGEVEDGIEALQIGQTHASRISPRKFLSAEN